MKRKTVHFGRLLVGTVPRVVGTITSLAALRSFRQPTPCDIVEVRLDRIGLDEEWLESCQAIEAEGCPILLTLRSALEGGTWRGSDADRLHLLTSALTVVSAVDIELESGLAPQVWAAANEHGKAVVVSYHDFTRTPDLATLEAVAARGASVGSVVKIATMIRSHSDIATLEALLARGRDYPMCVIGLGDDGTKTRVSLARQGSCLTYGYLDVPAAPGESSAKELREQLKQDSTDL